ncbi:MAG: hypothetical protein OEU09_06155, partial [Rhodospirillales bacterium]|nr:hypothetical protein [Rhodospirillales bacterium]
MSTTSARRFVAGPAARKLLLPLAVMVAAGVASPDKARAQEDTLCIPVAAVIKSAAVPPGEPCASPVALCTTGVISGGGILRGTTSFTALALGPAAGEPVTTLSYSGELVVTTKHGAITFSDAGIFDTDPAVSAFSELDRVVDGSGSGRFLGASGLLFIAGTASGGGAAF